MSPKCSLETGACSSSPWEVCGSLAWIPSGTFSERAHKPAFMGNLLLLPTSGNTGPLVRDRSALGCWPRCAEQGVGAGRAPALVGTQEANGSVGGRQSRGGRAERAPFLPPHCPGGRPESPLSGPGQGAGEAACGDPDPGDPGPRAGGCGLAPGHIPPIFRASIPTPPPSHKDTPDCSEDPPKPTVSPSQYL